MPTISVLNTDAGLSGKTILNAEDAQSVTGLKTFNRSTNAPFAVSSGAAVVTNLDADKLDGLEGSAYALRGGVANVTQILADDGTVSAPGLAISETDIGLYSSGTNALDFATNGTKALGIDSTQFIDSPTQPRVILYNSATQSITNNTYTTLNFDTETVDVGGMHAGGSPSRITIPTGGDGLYLVGGAVCFEAASSGANLGARLLKSGSVVSTVSQRRSGSVTADTSVQVQTLLSLTAGEYIELQAFADPGGSPVTGDGADRSLQNEFWAVKLW